jgi:hypothetical protein
VSSADNTNVTVAAEAIPRCSIGARSRGDSLVATAAPADGFLLIEQPGPWGIHALRESSVDAAVTHRLTEKAARAAVRILLIRRPGRSNPARRRWFVVDSRPGSERVRSGYFDDDRELLHLELLSGEPASRGEATPQEQLYLVCTHGRHDTCCAVEGRPVAAALAVEWPDQVWECSHLGGDRFAANLLVLPHGFTYGYVDPATAVEVVESYERGKLEPALLRGRSVYPAAVQAAQHFGRIQTGEHAVDALPPMGVEQRGDSWYVEVAAIEGNLGIVVRAMPDPPASRLTCRADHLGVPRHFELVELLPAL